MPAATQLFTLRWGIASPGAIAGRFVPDLLIDPKTRDVEDVRHRVVAVGSRSLEKAQAFISKHFPGDKACKPHGSYTELCANPNVDVIYIGSPHSVHYAMTKEALNAGKHVLLEKPATVNADQWKVLSDLAHNKKLFLMEAVWTRFFPLVHAYQDLIAQGAIGDVEHVLADFSMRRSLYDSSVEAPAGAVGNLRFLDPNLCGGSLMDAGMYPITHIRMAIPHPFGSSPPAEGPLPLPQISSTVVKAHPRLSEPYGGGDIDESAYATLLFPSDRANGGPHVVAQLSTSLMYHTPEQRSVVISGSKGRITVRWPPFQPRAFLLETWATEADYRARKPPAVSEERTFAFPGDCQGFCWEADETARCIRDGKLESERVPHRETMWGLQILDTIRRQNDYTFPASIEAV